MTATSTSDKQSSARRVLIYRLGSLGDTVVALPALHLVARAFPRAERAHADEYSCERKGSRRLRRSLNIPALWMATFATRWEPASLGDLARLWWTLFRWRPDVLVYLGSARGVASAQRDEKFFRLCGIRRMIGVPVTESMQTHRWEDATAGS